MKPIPFKVWFQQVNIAVISMTQSFGVDDLPDIGYWDLWNDGVSPHDAAFEVLENAGLTIPFAYE